METIINTAILDLVKFYITNKTPFSITIDNHNNWDTILPSRLSDKKRFRLDMQNTDLSDSYVDTNGDIIITAGIDDTVYTKVLEACDIHTIGLLQKEPIITKQFKEIPNSVIKPKAIPTNVEHSMDYMRRNNPHLFIKKILDTKEEK